MRELSAAGLRDDSRWVTCRRVAREVEPGLALRLAIELFKASREQTDLQLLKESYHRVDGFTKKQVWLPTELGPLWTSHRDALQLEVVEGALPQERTLNGMLADGVPRLVGKTAQHLQSIPTPPHSCSADTSKVFASSAAAGSLASSSRTSEPSGHLMSAWSIRK